MSATPVIVIFDIGKTNKKVFVFDEGLNILDEYSEHLPESLDDDQFPCEDVQRLSNWVKGQWNRLQSSSEWQVRAVNVSAYGASFVHLGKDGGPVTPLYNYLKPLPPHLRSAFHERYPGIWAETASPDLDNLNSGIQMFMIKHGKQAGFSRITRSLHLPQFVSYLITGKPFSDLTSIGCHTAMWDFTRSNYHSWFDTEGFAHLQADIVASDSTNEIKSKKGIIYSGIGLHDSSAALIPYLAVAQEPFCLLSTGTWSITLNPFNQSRLTESELSRDCLCYLSYHGKRVKASRLFSGHFHDVQVKVLAKHFRKPEHEYKSIPLQTLMDVVGSKPIRDISGAFETLDADAFASFESAYAYLIEELVARQVIATNLVLSNDVKTLYVDGGFSNNPLFMTLLAKAYPDHKVFATDVAQASAMGAAMAIHQHWTSKGVPGNILGLRAY